MVLERDQGCWRKGRGAGKDDQDAGGGPGI